MLPSVDGDAVAVVVDPVAAAEGVVVGGVVDVAESVAAFVGLLGAAVVVDVGAGAVDVDVDDVDGVAEPEDAPVDGLGAELDDDEPDGEELADELAVPVGVSVVVLVGVPDGDALDCGLEVCEPEDCGLGVCEPEDCGLEVSEPEVCEPEVCGLEVCDDWELDDCGSEVNVCEVIVLSGSRPVPVPADWGSATSDVNEVCVTPADDEVFAPLAPVVDLPAAAAVAAAAAEPVGCAAGLAPTGFAGAAIADAPAGWPDPSAAPSPSTAAAAHRPTTPTELSSTPFDGAVRSGNWMPIRWNAPDVPDLARAWRAPVRTPRGLSARGSGAVASWFDGSPGVAGVLESRIGLRSGRRGRTDPP